MSLSNGEIVPITAGQYVVNANIKSGAVLSFDMQISDEGYVRIKDSELRTNTNIVLSLPTCSLRVNIVGDVLANIAEIT